MDRGSVLAYFEFCGLEIGIEGIQNTFYLFFSETSPWVTITRNLVLQPLPIPVSLFLTMVMVKIQPVARPKHSTSTSASQESEHRHFG